MARITDVWANRRPKFNYITKNISKLTEGDRTFPDTCTQKRPIFGPVLVETLSGDESRTRGPSPTFQTRPDGTAGNTEGTPPR